MRKMKNLSSIRKIYFLVNLKKVEDFLKKIVTGKLTENFRIVWKERRRNWSEKFRICKEFVGNIIFFVISQIFYELSM